MQMLQNHLITIFLSLSYLGFAQNENNLVLNPGFEESSHVYPMKPCDFIRINTSFDKSMPAWNTFAGQTPDIVQWEEDRKYPCVYPQPRSGERMIGIINFLPHNDVNMPLDFHEFVQGSLKKPLEIGKEYGFEFYIAQPRQTANFHLKRVYGKITTAVPVSVNNLGFYFVEKPLDITTNMWKFIEDNNIKPHFNFEEIIFIEDGDWLRLTGTFTATKAYSHFILGNFFTDANTKNDLPEEQKAAIADFPTLYYMEEKKRVAYYCIDDFGIYEIDKMPELPTISLSKQLKEKGSYTFKNVNFATGKWNLRPAASAELDGLIDYLTKNPTLKIEIGGHTDNQGSTEANQVLSENRAKAVFEYLTAKGIISDRLTFIGYGETMPKASNETEEGRLMNRRVACVVQ